MSLVENIRNAELVLSPCGDEIIGTIEPYDLYGLTLWQASSYSYDAKSYTSREEAIAWLLYGMT